MKTQRYAFRSRPRSSAEGDATQKKTQRGAPECTIRKHRDWELTKGGHKTYLRTGRKTNKAERPGSSKKRVITAKSKGPIDWAQGGKKREAKPVSRKTQGGLKGSNHLDEGGGRQKNSHRSPLPQVFETRVNHGFTQERNGKVRVARLKKKKRNMGGRAHKNSWKGRIGGTRGKKGETLKRGKHTKTGISW